MLIRLAVPREALRYKFMHSAKHSLSMEQLISLKLTSKVVQLQKAWIIVILRCICQHISSYMTKYYTRLFPFGRTCNENYFPIATVSLPMLGESDIGKAENNFICIASKRAKHSFVKTADCIRNV